MSDLEKFAKRLDGMVEKIQVAKARRSELIRQQTAYQAKKEKVDKREQDAVLAKELVLQVAQKTQLNVAGRISDLVSLALAAVFDSPYAFQVDFVQRRGVTEADLLFVRDKNVLDPMTASGGGALDIASFALRLAIWTLGKSRPLFILDEPFRNLSLDLQSKAGLMLRELSRKLDIQIIMVSHNPEIISGADRLFQVGSDGKIQEG